MMSSNTGQVMTVANSIIGVGILAMPFCFQKCGVILSILLLIMNNLITRISCHYLIKSSILTRRKSFEFLAFHAFGPSGKLMVELCIIGYLIGTCIAYFVVVGDLGPQIVAKLLNINENDRLRTWVMITVTFLCIIPLGMLKNVDSLAAVCTASIGFYLCLVVKVIAESTSHIMANDWEEHLSYWKPSGVLQCLPIFSMALSCQMQLFEVFETVSNASLEKMNEIVKSATMICTCVYIFVGFFGYLAFCTQTFAGNILINFSPSLASDAIKIGFVLSVAFSFPLVIFPCRASIYSLLYKRGHVDNTAYIPEFRFKAITVSIVLFSLSIALLIPSIELVIGLVGSTIGVAICIMFPASCFMKVSKKESTEKHLAHFILIGGFCLMILGTYANLHAIDEKRSGSTLINEQQPLNIETEKPIIFPTPDISKLEEIIKIEHDRVLVKDDIKEGKQVEQNNKEKDVNDFKIKQENVEKPAIILPPEPEPPKVLTENKPVTVNKNIEPNIEKNHSNIEINKDALKKEDEIAAEEQSKQKETNKAEIELRKTKELLEKKVDELQQQLKKQNEETQNLVVEKLGKIAEKVDQIEREVHADSIPKENIVLKEEIKDDKLSTILKQKLAQENKLNKSNKESVVAVSEQNAVSDNKKETNDKVPSIAKGSLIGMMTENLKDSKIIKQEKDIQDNKVFEPLSYKTGEILNKIHNELMNSSKAPLPLPLLINSSFQNPEVPSLPSSKISKIDEVPKIEKQKESDIEAPRRDRDILQVVTEKDNVGIGNYNREKRSTEKDTCINWNAQLDSCQDQKNLELIIPKEMTSLKVESIGRDLKSVKEET